MTRYSLPAHSFPAGGMPPTGWARPTTEARVPGIALWSFLGFFVFSLLNGAGLLTIRYEQNVPIQPIMFALAAVMVVPWTRAKPGFSYFVVAWVYVILFAIGGFFGPYRMVSLVDYHLAQLVLKLWISLVGLPYLALRAINRDKVPMLIKIAVASAALGAVFAVVQMLRPGPFKAIMAEPGRGAGFWVNPNACSAVCAFCLFASFIAPFRGKLTNLAVRFALAAGVMSSLSRTGMLILVLGFVVYGIAAKRLRTVLQVGTVLVVFAVAGGTLVGYLKSNSKAASKRLDSVQALFRGDVSQGQSDRVMLWRYGMDAVRRDWLVGRGHRSMDNIVPLGTGFGPHNYYIYVWGNSGLMALLAFLAYLVTIYRMGARCQDRQQRAALIAMTAMLAAIAMFDHSFLANQFFGPVFGLMAVTAYYGRPPKKPPGPVARLVVRT